MARDRRLDLGLSREEVAACAGMPAEWVAELEADRTSPDLASVLRLLDLLGIRLEAGLDSGREIPQWSGGVVDLDQVLTRYLEWSPDEPGEREQAEEPPAREAP